ncbi:phage tail protein [Kushneria sp. Sum13]|uniref:phage tail protein n=1 Tax=Kushneria sp. Sum13 TaxID=3459196 RepID=UPI004045DDEF
MSQFFTLLTKTGQGLLANAIAYGEPLTIATMAIGDGGGKLPTPDATVTRLVNEVRRGPINQNVVDDDNPNWTVVEQVLPADVGGWTIREVGLYDTDGNLIAYGNYPETYKPQLSEGSARTQTIRFVMEVTDTSAVTLRIDPSVVMASRQYVDDQLDAHAKSRNHPAADTKNSGMMRFATLAESKKGEESKAAQTPAGGKAQLDDHRKEEDAHDSSQIGLVEALEKFGGADTVQAVLAMLGSAARKDAGAAPLLTLDDFTSGQSLGGRGVQPLPGGLILQWCEIVISGTLRTNTSNGMNVVMHDDGASGSLPIPFPNECLGRVGSFGDIAESFIENMTLDGYRSTWSARCCGLASRPAGTTYTARGTAFFLGR